MYYNGGGHFIVPSPVPSNINVIARYSAGSTGSTDGNKPIAAVLTTNGKGKSLLSSVHFEYPLSDPPARDAISRLPDPPDKRQVEQSDKVRVQWAEELLQLIGLTPVRRRPDDPSSSLSTGAADEDPALLLHPTFPSPIFVLPNPDVSGLPDCFAVPAIASKLRDETGIRALRDANDELRLYEASRLPDTASTSDGVTAYLSRARRTAPVFPPSVQKLSMESDAPPEPPLTPNFHSIPKTIITPNSSLPYSARWTPLFNFDSYWMALTSARKRLGSKVGQLRKDTVDGGERPLVGDLLWYAETVTSTQTMLDG